MAELKEITDQNFNFSKEDNKADDIWSIFFQLYLIARLAKPMS